MSIHSPVASVASTLLLATLLANPFTQFDAMMPDDPRPSDNPQQERAQAEKKTVAARFFEMEQLLAKHKSTKRSYTGFFKVPSMSAGIYTLPKGGSDGQGPHREDEVYYVLAGKAKMKTDGREVPVAEGSLIFIAAGETHRFVEIEEDLELLVLFSTGPVQKADKREDK